MNCRHCQSPLDLVLADFGVTPVSNALLSSEALASPEGKFPLKVLVCDQCWLAQTSDCVDPEEIFDSEYSYHSSYSKHWLDHAERYAHDMVKRFEMGRHSHVIEVASNDGYLLQFFLKDGIPCLGVEPASGVASIARDKGIEVISGFFGSQLAVELTQNGRQADLLVANNVLAHVPDINDFVSGVECVLKPSGVASFEFPSLLRLVQGCQFDTIYHEHYSYLSLTAVNRIFRSCGLEVFDVEELPTHGGSLRVFAQKSAERPHRPTGRAEAMLEQERLAGVATQAFYSGFNQEVDKRLNELNAFLGEAKKQGCRIAGYGAAAKGIMLLNHARIDRSTVAFVADRNPVKQGRHTPGSHIPISPESRIIEERPDVILILPWNLRLEIRTQLEYAREWGARFVTAVPELEVFS